jgi:hypothetical protein
MFGDATKPVYESALHGAERVLSHRADALAT